MREIKKCLFIFLFVLGLFITFPIKTYAAVSADRIWGKDRYATSLEISRNGWNKSSTVIIASGENFPDALSATPLAKMYNAPILLIKGGYDCGGLGNVILNELKRLETNQVIIVGGYGAIPQTVEYSLQSEGISFTRLGGQDRYETSVLINQKLETPSDKIVITTGEDFADALSISTIAAKNSMPIILLPKDTIPGSVRSYLNGKQISKTYVLGGQDIISDNVTNQFPSPERISGNNKYERNIAILNKFSSDINFDTLYFASGNGFADALSGSALASQVASPIILISDPVQDLTKKFINDNISKFKNSVILGGTGSIRTSTVEGLGNIKEITYLTDVIDKPSTVGIRYKINNNDDRSTDSIMYEKIINYSGKVYNKGIMMILDDEWGHEKSNKIMFNINNKFSRFTSLIVENEGSNVEFKNMYIRVYVDNELKQEVDFKKGDSFDKLDVDLKKGSQLKIEFAYPDDYGDSTSVPSFDLLNPIIE